MMRWTGLDCRKPRSRSSVFRQTRIHDANLRFKCAEALNQCERDCCDLDRRARFRRRVLAATLFAHESAAFGAAGSAAVFGCYSRVSSAAGLPLVLVRRL
jgi:hypothetical protein